MKHLEKNTTPFGLLSKEEQDYLEDQVKQGKQLLIWGTIGPNEWVCVDDDLFYSTEVYRTIAAPERVVGWVNVYPFGNTSDLYKSRICSDEGGVSTRTCVFRLEWNKEDGSNPTITREEV